MQIYLVQHGEAVSKAIDAQRPLSATGRVDVERTADFLGKAGIRVGRVWHSGKTRAGQTAAILAARLSPGVTPQALSGLQPNDDVEPVAEMLTDGAGNTLLVGHLPFMARLVSRLVVDEAEYSTVMFEPGSMVCLDRDDDGVWTIAWMLRPALFAVGA